MSYYILEPACDTPETGPIYPQIQKLRPGYDENKPNSIYSYLKQSRLINDFPGIAPDLDSFIMNGRAKQTDMVSNAITSGSGLFINQKVKAIFEMHNLTSHRFYPAQVIHRKKPLKDYFWCHTISDFTSLIDYSNSNFFIRRKMFEDTGADIEINSLEDYLKKDKQLRLDNPGINIMILAKRICLYPAFFDKKLDLFKIGLFDANFYISEALKDALFENKITGCEIHSTDKIMN